MLELEYPGLKFGFYYIEQLPETTRAWVSDIWPSLILTSIALNTRINPGFGQVKPKPTQTRPARIMKDDTRMMLELENFRPDPALIANYENKIRHTFITSASLARV